MAVSIDKSILADLTLFSIAKLMERDRGKIEKALRNKAQKKKIITRYNELISKALYLAGMVEGGLVTLRLLENELPVDVVRPVTALRIRTEADADKLLAEIAAELHALFDEIENETGENFVSLFRGKGAPRKPADPPPWQRTKREQAQIEIISLLVCNEDKERKSPLDGLEKLVEKFQDDGRLIHDNHDADIRQIQRRWKKMLENDDLVQFPTDMLLKYFPDAKPPEKTDTYFGMRARDIAARFRPTKNS